MYSVRCYNSAARIALVLSVLFCLFPTLIQPPIVFAESTSLVWSTNGSCEVTAGVSTTGYSNNYWWQVTVDWGDGSTSRWRHDHEDGGGTTTSSRTHTYGSYGSYTVNIDPENGNTWDRSVNCQAESDPTPDPTPEPTEEPEPPAEIPDIPTLPDNPDSEPLTVDIVQNSQSNGNSGGRRSSRNADSETLLQKEIASAPTYTCRYLPASVLVVPYTQGVQCQIVGGAGIGIPSILEQGLLAAVNVWGPANLQADVCFAARGRILFLNSNFVPSRQEAPPSYSPRADVTCVTIGGPGTVILLPGAPDQVAVETEAEAPPVEPKRLSNLVFLIEDPMESALPLANCRIITRQNIHVRMAPAGERTGLIVAGRNLEAPARTDNWFKVTLEGDERWVSAHFVHTIGQCEPQGGATAESLEDLRANSGRLSNLAFLVNDEPENALPLEGCQVRARQNINVRMEPAGQRTGLIMSGQALSVLARTENWFKVALDGEERWVSAHFVNMSGQCQAQAASPPAPAAEDPSADADDGASLAELAEEAIEVSASLPDCRVTTRQDVLARMTPAGESSSLVRSGQRLQALARSANWLMVLVDGAGLWVSDEFVDMTDGCQLQGVNTG